MGRLPRSGRWLTILTVTVLAGLGAMPAAAGTAASGSGSMSVSPSSVVAASTGNKLVFTFTAANGKDFATGSYITLTVPAGWPAPSMTSGATGYTTAASGSGGSGCALPTSPNPLSISGSVITVTQACSGGTSFTVTYGASSTVTAPTTAQGYTFTAASHAGPGGTPVALASSPVVTVTAGAAAKVAFNTQPSNSTGGVAFPTQPVVAVQDANGNTVTGDTSSVTLALTTPAGAQLSCTTNPLSAAAGVATFAGCKIDKTGSYTLKATDGSLTPATSSSVTISVGPAAQLAFTTQPGGSTGGMALSPQPSVTVQDAGGNAVTADNSAVTLALTTAAGATLACTTNPVTASSGVAAFAGCKVDKAGSYTLTASDGSLTSGVSSSFAISVGPAAKLGFSTQPPSTGTAGSALANFQVAVQDAGGNTVASGTGATDTITVGIASGPTGGTFNSTATTYTNVAASGGVATFSGVVLNTAGAYTFSATDTSRTGISQGISNTVTIAAAAASKLAFVQGPSDSFAGSAMSPAVTVQVQDQYGNAAPAGGTAVNLAASAGTIDAGSSATTSASGLATFGGLTINTAATGLTLTASASGLTSTPTSNPFNVTVKVTNASAALTDTATDAGSGVKSVAYYYCTGYTGGCTSTNWHLIGSSTTATGGYPFTWASQPVNGAYQLVVVGTDNVSNTSSASASIPVTVAN